MQYQPYATKNIKSPKEDKIYFCKLYQPHILAEAINLSFPEFATHYAVNIGAGDGKSCNDPVFPLYYNGFGGLAVEGGQNQALYEKSV